MFLLVSHETLKSKIKKQNELRNLTKKWFQTWIIEPISFLIFENHKTESKNDISVLICLDIKESKCIKFIYL